VVDDIDGDDARPPVVDADVERSMVRYNRLSRPKVDRAAGIPESLVGAEQATRAWLEGIGWHRRAREEPGEIAGLELDLEPHEVVDAVLSFDADEPRVRWKFQTDL